LSLLGKPALRKEREGAFAQKEKEKKGFFFL